MEVTAKRALRTAVMKWVFDTTGGSDRELAHGSQFAVPDGWNEEIPTEKDVADAIRWLEGEYLIKAHWTMGGLPSVQLTHTGIREMEQAVAAPTERTEHFVPLVNITTIHGSVIGSQLQQGSPGATQTGNFEINQRENAEAFVAAVRKILDNEDVDPQTHAQADSDLAVMSRELASPSPRWQILQTFGASIRDYLVTAVGTAVGAGILGILWP